MLERSASLGPNSLQSATTAPLEADTPGTVTWKQMAPTHSAQLKTIAIVHPVRLIRDCLRRVLEASIEFTVMDFADPGEAANAVQQ